MFYELKPKKFTFRCETCQALLTSEFEDERDIDDIREDKLWLECPCDGKAYVLRD